MMDRKTYDAMSRGQKMQEHQNRGNARSNAENILGSARSGRKRNVEERGEPAGIYDADVAKRTGELRDARAAEEYQDLVRGAPADAKAAAKRGNQVRAELGYAAGGMVRRGFGKARGA